MFETLRVLLLAEGGRCKPVFEALGGAVSYEAIRVVMAHREAGEGRAGAGPCRGLERAERRPDFCDDPGPAASGGCA